MHQISVKTLAPRLLSVDDAPIARLPIARTPIARTPIARTPIVDTALADNAVVAVSVSGGKDGAAAALAVAQHLTAIGHRGPQLLIHADLGVVEWEDSLPSCHRLADRLGWPLITVARPAGDLYTRWVARWQSSLRRYAALDIITLIPPWSSAQHRFCTSELKTAIIHAELRRRFKTRTILNVTGLRADESPRRARQPIVEERPDLARQDGTRWLDWRPILHWTRDQVLHRHELDAMPLHQAYHRHGMSRVSCTFCVLASATDLASAAAVPDNHGIYRALVRLERLSGFSFQPAAWLADLAPGIHGCDVAAAKSLCARRRALDAALPASLRFDRRGQAAAVPTAAEARLLADTRRRVADLYGLAVGFTDPDTIRQLYRSRLPPVLDATPEHPVQSAFVFA